MPIISTSIPNMINGVSQQPEALRLASQCELMENCYPSVVEGLRKRPPTRHVAKILDGTLGEATIHMINRDTSERYIVVISNGNLRVFDLLGQEKAVAFEAGAKDYLLASTPGNSFRTLSIADYTFILNTEVTAKMAPDLSTNRGTEAIVFIKATNYSTDFKITVNSTEATYSFGSSAPISTTTAISTLATSLTTALGAGWSIQTNGPVMWIKRTDGADFTIKATDSRSNSQIEVFKGQAQRFSELPTIAPKDFLIEVIGDQSSSFDNYYVKFVPNNATASFDAGVWKETVKQGIKFRFDATTMPHALVRQADGSFLFKKVEWGERICGDEDSCPEPTFVDRKISDMFLHKNRLGFLSDENVIMSRASEFFEFFPSTVTTSLDSDPIDVAATSSKVSILRYAVPFNEDLLLFSDQSQFNFAGGDVLSNTTASIDVMTEFESNMDAKPVGAGRTVFFAANKGLYDGVREYFIDTSTDTKDATDVTVQVPTYIPRGIFKMACSTNEEILLVLTSGERNSVYAYKYYWGGQEKMQSAWGKFIFSDNAKVLSVGFVDVTAYLIIQYPDGVYLEKLSCEPGHIDDYAPFEYALDRKVTEAGCVSVTFDEGTGLTAFKLPYIPDAEMQVATRHHAGPYLRAPGISLRIAKVEGDTVYVYGDHVDQKVYVGQRYVMRYRFSKQVLKEEAAGGGQAIIGSGRLQIKFWTLVYDGTGFFKVEVTPQYRPTNTYSFTGKVLGSASATVGGINLEAGRFKVPIMSLNDRFTLDIVNDTFLPCRFLSAEWEAMYTLRSKRL